MKLNKCFRSLISSLNIYHIFYKGCNYDWSIRANLFNSSKTLTRQKSYYEISSVWPAENFRKRLKMQNFWFWSLVDFNRAKELFSLIDATIIGKSRAYTLVLKDLYDPLNPDKDTVQTRQNISIEQYKSHFLGHLRPTLRKAKYNRVPQEIVESMAQYVEIPERGLQVKIKLKDYELVEMWYKGELFGDRARLASREPHESIWKFVESQWVSPN